MNIDEFNIFYSKILNKISAEKKEIYIMGDFNIDLLKFDTNLSHEEFPQYNLSSGLKPYIIRPTRITPTSKSLIDNIFSNNIDPKNLSGNVICSISDHLPQFLLINKNKSYERSTNHFYTWRDFRNFNRENSF